MLSPRQALARVLADVPRLPTVSVDLADAWGRTLGEDLVAKIDVPRWDNSAMDGYAVRAADTAEGEVALRIVEVIGAGAVATRAVEKGTAIAIMTGAPIPEGADAVVMVEDTDRAMTGAVKVRRQAKVGQHVRSRGEDVRVGDLLLAAGTRLGAAALGVAASQGFERVVVSRRPVVAILSTGDEVVQPGRPLEPGQLWSSNGATLRGLVIEAGGVPIDVGNAPDRLDAIVEKLNDCLARADVVVTTGGVSVGEFDHVKAAFEQVGVPMDFWKVRMKPGKPLAFGVSDREGSRVPVFGLPGNPVSCMVNFVEFVRPWLLTAMGAKRIHLPTLTCRAGEVIHGVEGRTDLVRVVIERDGGGFACRPTGSQSSGVLTSMARAHGLAIVDGTAQKGSPLTVQVLDTGFLDGDSPGFS